VRTVGPTRRIGPGPEPGFVLFFGRYFACFEYGGKKKSKAENLCNLRHKIMFRPFQIRLGRSLTFFLKSARSKRSKMDDKDSASLVARKSGGFDHALACRRDELKHTGAITSELQEGPSINQWAIASVTDRQYYAGNNVHVGPRSAHDYKIDRSNNKGISKKIHVNN
jgi:hypothetical protein